MHFSRRIGHMALFLAALIGLFLLGSRDESAEHDVHRRNGIRDHHPEVHGPSQYDNLRLMRAILCVYMSMSYTIHRSQQAD